MTVATARKSTGLTAAYRWSVASRVAAAALGGYVLSTLASIMLSLTLPMSRGEAVLTALQVSFAIYTAAVIWVFAVRSVRRAWFGMLAANSVCGVILLVIRSAS